MKFEELTETAKRKIHADYVQAMDNDENRAFTLSFSEYCEEALFDLDCEDFDEHGNIIE